MPLHICLWAVLILLVFTQEYVCLAVGLSGCKTAWQLAMGSTHVAKDKKKVSKVLTCPAIFTAVVQIVQLLQILWVNDGGTGCSVGRGPGGAGSGTSRSVQIAALPPCLAAAAKTDCLDAASTLYTRITVRTIHNREKGARVTPKITIPCKSQGVKCPLPC